MTGLSIVIAQKGTHIPVNWMQEYLDSLKAQLCQDFELIWVGDRPSSTLSFPNVPAEIIETDVRICPAFNIGVAHASSSLIAAQSSHDTLHPEYVEAALKAFNTNPNIHYWVPNGTGLSEEIINNSVMCGAPVIKQWVWEHLGGFMDYPFDGGEDWHLWMRLWKAGAIGVVDPRTLWNWRRHPESMSDTALGTGRIWTKRNWMWTTLDKVRPLE